MEAPIGEAHSSIEVPAFNAPVVFVHVNIPAASALGHKADFWRVDKPDYNCRLACFSKGDSFILRLFECKSGEIFAECLWPADRPVQAVVDPATDSSRYFAIKIVNPSNNSHTWIGMGFGDRDTASEFKAALLEHSSYLQRMRDAEVARQKRQEMPEVDMSLKSATITIKLPTDTSKRKEGGLMSRLSAGPSLFAAPAADWLMNRQAPPESDASSADVHPRVSGASTLAANAVVEDVPAGTAAPSDYDDSDFGDFVSSAPSQ